MVRYGGSCGGGHGTAGVRLACLGDASIFPPASFFIDRAWGKVRRYQSSDNQASAMTRH